MPHRRLSMTLVGALVLAACSPAAVPRGEPPTAPPPQAAAANAVPDAPLAEPETWARWSNADYVVLAPRDFLAALAPLVAHREAGGHVVAALAVEDLFTRFSAGKPEPRALREALRVLARHADGKLRFVLLVGDARKGDSHAGEPPVPTFYRTKLVYQNQAPIDPLGYAATSGSARPQYPTDRPYAALEDDTATGARAEDPPPPLAVGRVPARTVAEVEGFVKKTIGYETGQPLGAWSRRLALFAGPANFGMIADRLIESTAFHILEDEVSYDYDIDVVFAKLESPYAYRFDRLRDKLAEDLGQGALIAAYVGHGSYWSFDDVSFRDRWYDIGTADDAARLRIPTGKPFFLSFTCDTGAFDLAGGRRSIAEELVLNPEGPIAVFASSRESHPYTNALYGAAVVEHFVSGRAPTIGEGLIKVRQQVRHSSIGLAELLVQNDIEALKDEHEGLYNLFGDPATRLRYPDRATVTWKAKNPGSDTVRPGARVDVEVVTDKVRGGHVLLTLETLRSAIRAKLVSPATIEGMREPEALAAMAANHKKAVDKVVLRREADLAAGRATFQLTLPREPGSYVVKAFIGGPDGAAAGHARLQVSGAK